ncbi:hypothetical protein [Streptomyces sp. Je 1-369]|uniref:hypothetical protein n=1 Tax=Streptomyces sp. Je 1-369 TaxID=2966192 RepID=UPI0022854809|nr:hypothetical protein [Streptomyces sp. Je 1-369]WAL99651.1 hypothetical protein NOO62_37395 [Streptomyces sp. Je 1-369]
MNGCERNEGGEGPTSRHDVRFDLTALLAVGDRLRELRAEFRGGRTGDLGEIGAAQRTAAERTGDAVLADCPCRG